MIDLRRNFKKKITFTNTGLWGVVDIVVFLTKQTKFWLGLTHILFLSIGLFLFSLRLMYLSLYQAIATKVAYYSPSIQPLPAQTKGCLVLTLF